MYSYEDRIRAVKLYIRLDKRTGAILRQLDCPPADESFCALRLSTIQKGRFVK